MATRQKEKAARRAETRDRRPKAVVRYARIAPRKARAVIDQIRGRSGRHPDAFSQRRE